MDTVTGKRLNELTASEIAAATTSGRVTCEAVAQAHLERIAERDPAVFAWYHHDPEHVLKQARALDQGPKQGALYGVPFGIKDIIDTYDLPTEYGSPIYKGCRPADDAACVALSRKAGGVLLGKTVTTEFANRHPGATRHPMDPTRTPGGSSSGSAAAVGDRMVPLAIGTQTTASTIRPAAFNGCVGYRPTWGELTCSGVRQASGTLDTLGLISRSVEDIALWRAVLLGTAPEPIAAAPAPRIGFCRTPMWNKVDSVYQAKIEDAVQRLARAGAKVTDVTLPPDFERLQDAHRWISSYEFARNFTHEIEHHWEQISETLRNNRLKDGLSCPYDRYRDAITLAESCREQLSAVWKDYDVLIGASSDGEAPVGLNATGDASFCVIWTTMHVPAVTLPMFTGRNNLPLGLQVIAPRREDRKLFSHAQWISRALA
jgi:amidase